MGDDLDPFGRKKDENPLASLGWRGDETASGAELEPEPADVAAPAAAVTIGSPPPRARDRQQTADASAPPGPSPGERATPRTRTPKRRSPVTTIIRTVIFLGIVIALLGGVIGSLVGEGVDRVEEFGRDFEAPDVQVPAVPGTDERSPTGRPQATLPARGLSVTSLLRPAAFGRAMNRLRTGGYGRLMNLRVAPDRIDASMLTKDGRLRQVQVVPGGVVRVIGTSPPGFTGAQTMALKGIDRNAPSRLTRSAAGRLKQPASRVDYLVLSEFAGTRQWNVYFKGGQIFSADARGRITRRIS